MAFTEFSSGLGNYSTPGGIATGPDGNLWFTDDGCDGYPGTCAIGQITTAGKITEFTAGLTPGNVPGNIVTGPDGNLWFTASNSNASTGNAVGRITPHGSITEFPLSSNSQANYGIALGPDANLWFTDDSTPTGAIGRITPSGAITEFSHANGLNLNSQPQDIAAGPDGNLWFTDSDVQHGTAAAIGRVTPSGKVTEFESGLLDGSEPDHIAAGPDGNMWFTDEGETRAIGKITPNGQITEYPLTQGAGAVSITAGPDGNMWFTDAGVTPSIGRITPGGQITEYPTGQPDGADPSGITVGPDGNLWFTNFGSHSIGKLTLQLPPAVTTGAASAVTSSGATVAGTVNPAGGAVSSISVQYGRTTAYGSTAGTTPATLPSGGKPIGVSATLAHLPSRTLIHYRLVATNAYGTTDGNDQTVTTSSPRNGTGSGKPTLGQARESHRTWSEPGAKARRHLPVGTTFSFTLHAPARVRLAFTRHQAGRRVGRRCVARTRSNRHHHACTRSLPAGSYTVKGHAGLNKLAFHGRISRSRTLKPGSYTVTLTVSTRTGHSTPAKLTFTIRR